MEADMPTSDDYFFATGIADVSGEGGMPGFSTDSDDNGKPNFVLGGQLGGQTAGVWGLGGGATDDVILRIWGNTTVGVIGSSAETGLGVFGQSGTTSTAPIFLTAGVLGTADTSAGVIGWSTTWNGVEGWASQGTGVLGVSVFDRGVHGGSTWQPGVQGWSENDLGVMGGTGPEDTQGPVVPNTSNVAGVVGTSDQRHGVIGTSNKSVGVIGFSNNIGVFGYTTNPQARAGYFIGDVFVDGNFTVVGYPNQHTKSVAVPFPDGTLRALYCMESPEVWFEDFGPARLRSGRAVVKLDPDFAKVIKRGDYKVFLTPEGDCHGLYVRRKAAAGFEVRELMGGKSSIAFSYRIVGRRKDIKEQARFAKIDTRRLRLPTAATREARKPTRTASKLRAAIARLQKKASQRSDTGRKTVRRAHS
jgi:hypothetical protein